MVKIVMKMVPIEQRVAERIANAVEVATYFDPKSGTAVLSKPALRVRVLAAAVGVLSAPDLVLVDSESVIPTGE